MGFGRAFRWVQGDRGARGERPVFLHHPPNLSNAWPGEALAVAALGVPLQRLVSQTSLKITKREAGKERVGTLSTDWQCEQKGLLTLALRVSTQVWVLCECPERVSNL